MKRRAFLKALGVAAAAAVVAPAKLVFGDRRRPEFSAPFRFPKRPPIYTGQPPFSECRMTIARWNEKRQQFDQETHIVDLSAGMKEATARADAARQDPKFIPKGLVDEILQV